MSRSLVRSFLSPDEHREFSSGFLDLITVGALTFGQETLEPSWRWSKDVRPLAGTDRCEFHHVGFQVSGRWVCEDRDGTQVEVSPGDIFDTPPGHDAWVVGDEPCVTIDFQGIADWATRASSARILTSVLFADVVDSTALIDEIGDPAWRRLQAQFFENVQVVLSTQNGSLIDTAGDGILARFNSPVAAVRAATALLLAAERIDLQVRAAVHTGEVEQTSNGLSGMAVHIGARVLAHAGTGEVLVTSSTRDLTLDAGIDYDERGAVELKGVPGARTLYALRATTAVPTQPRAPE
ncbi:MAG: adenylate/guanylate cyclase domain-containing protein [Chloroflexota bacterium]